MVFRFNEDSQRYQADSIQKDTLQVLFAFSRKQSLPIDDGGTWRKQSSINGMHKSLQQPVSYDPCFCSKHQRP